MTDQLFCPQCGAPQVAGARFCFKCGSPLPGDLPVQAPAPVQPPAAPPAAVAPPVYQPVAPTASPVAPVAPVAVPAWAQPPVAPPVAAPPAAPYPPAPPYAAPAWSIPQTPQQPGPAYPYGVPAAPAYHAAGQPHVAGQRPTGIAILAILEAVGGLLCLWVAGLLFDHANTVSSSGYCVYYGECNSGGAQFVGLIYLAVAVASFVAAWGLFSIRPWAWFLGCALAAASVGSAILSLLNDGNVVGLVINVGINAAVLYYLNLNDIRALFGRGPATFMQMQPH